jgi:hypothetical protein
MGECQIGKKGGRVKKEKIDGRKNRKKKLKWGNGGECKNILKKTKKNGGDGKNQGKKKRKGGGKNTPY